jgi:hypothetical protein
LAKRTSVDPLLWKNVIPSHAAPSDWLGGIHDQENFGTKKGATLEDDDPFPDGRAYTMPQCFLAHKITRGGCCAFPGSKMAAI